MVVLYIFCLDLHRYFLFWILQSINRDWLHENLL